MRGMAPTTQIMRRLSFLLYIPLCYCNNWYSWENFRYFVSSEQSLNYSEAENACVSIHSAQLTSISSLDEKNFLIQHLLSSTVNYWIGLWINASDRCSDCSALSPNGNVPISCTECRRKWKYIDTTPMSEDIVQSTWNYNQPTGDANCGKLRYNFRNGFGFADIQCGQANNFICKQVGYCHENPCRNGGSCNSRSDSFDCSCRAGFTGLSCETDVNECSSNPCIHGMCIDITNDYSCDCNGTRYSGQHCEIAVDECESNPCVHGECIDTINGYMCDCYGTEYNGQHCETDVNVDTIAMGCVIGLLVLTNTFAVFLLVKRKCMKVKKDAQQTAVDAPASLDEYTYIRSNTPSATTISMVNVHVSGDFQQKRDNTNEICEHECEAYQTLHVYQN